MNSRIHYNNCPVCSSPEIQFVFNVKDHTVSGESFPVFLCNDCSARFTQDIPDPGSIGAYYKSEDYISHTNTSKGLINRLYQLVRKRTLRQKRKLVEKATGVKNGSILDVGCGIGSFIYEMKQNDWQVTGLEPDEDAKAIAKQLYNIEPGTIEKLYELTPGTFDAITLWHVLEHVHDLQGYVKKLKELLKAKGKLFIAVPNYTSKDAAIYKEFWAAYDVPRHLYHFSPASMQLLMEKHGLKVQKFKPMWFDSFYVSMLSSKYKNGKTNLIASVWNGFVSNLKAIANPQKCSSVIYIISK